LGISPQHPGAERRPFAAARAIAGAEVDDCGSPKGELMARMRRVRPGMNLARTEGNGKHFSYIRCPVDRPAMTIQKSVTFGGLSIWHPTEERNCSIGELKRLSSFPDEFVFVGSYKDAVNCIGNSVPPLFMRAIAEHVKRLICPTEAMAVNQ
jgi:DNA (cytosine-5)-methyltransferase 1